MSQTTQILIVVGLLIAVVLVMAAIARIRRANRTYLMLRDHVTDVNDKYRDPEPERWEDRDAG